MDRQQHEEDLQKFFAALQQQRMDTESYKLALQILERFVQERPYDINLRGVLVGIKTAADDLLQVMSEEERR